MFDLPQIEEEILDFWNKNKIFQKSLDKESPRGDYVFYDGPPFATGLPHYGHIVASLIKDIVPRYFTMQGYHVGRKWGWDCHGLPIENIVEQELKLKAKKDIEKLGVDKFNQACRTKVLIYAEEWRKTINRLGRWVDLDNGYKTMDLDYMESIWWAFKQLWDKDLIYQGRKSMHICPRCETTLSQSEVSQAYIDIEDISVITKFELSHEPGTFVLAWTTTPWTLPGNVALAVGADVAYVKVAFKNEKFILAKANLESLMAGRAYKVVGELIGRELEGQAYKPLFDYYDQKDLANIQNAFKIYLADFVTIEDGTGVVHIAPAFGEDDMNLGLAKDLPFVQHVSLDGRFTDQVKDFKGLEVKSKSNTQATDKKIVDYLRKKDLVFDSIPYTHSYPHCWRCDTPLLNYTTSSWFVAVTKIKDEAIQLAKNINWTPAHIKDGRFGKWLEGARDWSISRQRYWGSVMPIWQCDKCEDKKVFGSRKELEDITGEKINDLHKHIIDKITFNCDKCDGTMQRIPDVLDCWFESGSMPYAQLHYPFDNKDKFEANFPAEFIAEGADQTRAWFYYLHILSTALKNSHSFKNVIVNGIVLAKDGKKMSKKLNNYPDPSEIFDKYGADPLRYYLCASPVMRAEDMNFNESDLKEHGRFFNTLLNVLSFYTMFTSGKQVDDLKDSDLTNVLDQWITARLEEFKKVVTQRMDNYDLGAIRDFPIFIDDLSTWYVRRSRERFKGADEADKLKALKTLRRVLYHLSRTMAPFLPFMAEHLYQTLGPDIESVHLKEWPQVKEKLIDQKVLDYMDITRKIVEQGLAKRAEAGLKVRQPLVQATVKGAHLSQEYVELIKDELNVKQVEFDKAGETIQVELDTALTPELKQEGLLREIVRTVNQMRKKMNLTIKDKITLEYSSTDKEVLAVFDKYAPELSRGVLADKLERTDKQLDKVKINDNNIGIHIKK